MISFDMISVSNFFSAHCDITIKKIDIYWNYFLIILFIKKVKISNYGKQIKWKSKIWKFDRCCGRKKKKKGREKGRDKRRDLNVLILAQTENQIKSDVHRIILHFQ